MSSIIKRTLKYAAYQLRAMKSILFYRRFISPKVEKDIVEQFHMLYYNSRMFGNTWADTTFLGTETEKCPLDLWIYQEIIYQIKPEIIIETGTFRGGSALYMASICDLINHGEVITIDILERKDRPKHNRIEYMSGSSTSPEIIETVKKRIQGKSPVLVILDSDHSKEHVLNELNLYGSMVTKNSYLIVEDSNINGHPVRPEFGPGPMEAIDEYLKNNTSYTIDKKMERFFLTFNPNGYLKRIK
jgi:cephalosporin hydroxylase